MNPDLAYYVVEYYFNLMNDVERRAYNHLAGTMKATKGRDDLAAQREAINHRSFHRLLTSDPQVLELTKDGMQAFRTRVAARILVDHEKELRLNYCPQCQKLARTPNARQCRFCGYDWHSEIRDQR